MRMEKRTYQAPDFEMERFAKDEMEAIIDSPTDTEVDERQNEVNTNFNIS